MSNDNKKGQIGAAIAGAAVGAAVATAATLLADEKNRKVLGKKLDQTLKTAKKGWDSVSGQVADKIQEEKKKLEKK